MALDETTNWEEVFEDPEKGLVPLIMQAQSPEALKQTAHLVIRKLHSRKGDERHLAKFAEALENLIPVDALENDIAVLQIGVKKLLRQIKKDRQRKAAEYRVSQYSIRNRDRRANRAEPNKKKPFWKTRAGMMVAASLVIAVVFISTLKDPGLSPEKEAEGRLAVRWLQYFVARNLPMTSLRLSAVRMAGGTVIEMDIAVSKVRDPKVFNALKEGSQMIRADALKIVCPSAKSGVKKFIDQGWSIWVVFKDNKKKKLTAGGCSY